jgi:hypothetical protein
VLVIAAGFGLTACQRKEADPSSQREFDQKMAHSLAEKLSNDMAQSWLDLKRADISDYLVDNLNTHLVLKWIDFDIADRTTNSWKRLVSIDSIKVYDGKFKKIAENQAAYETFVEIRYTRHEPSVNGINLDLFLEFEKIDGKWMITSADLIGASIYREWKEKKYQTIAEMDQAFVDSCQEYGLHLPAE